MKLFTLLACLFLLIGIGQAQVEISGKGTGNTITITNDNATIAAMIGDSIAFPVDTTALKLLNMDEGRVAHVKDVGWFVVADSAKWEGVIAFDHPTAGLQWIEEEWLRSKTFWLRPSFTDDQTLAVFDAIGEETGPVILRFQKGNYFWRGGYDPNYVWGAGKVYDLRGCNKIIIDMGGSTIDMADRAWYITTHDSLYTWTNTERWNTMLGGGLNYKYAHDFTTPIYKDSTWVGVEDTTAWGSLQWGDLLKFDDGTGYIQTQGSENTYVGFFDHWEGNNQGADSGRMVLQNRSLTTIDFTYLSPTDCTHIIIVPMRKSYFELKNGTIINGAITARGFDAVNVSNYYAYLDTTKWYEGGVNMDWGVSGFYPEWFGTANIVNVHSKDYMESGGGYGLSSGWGWALNVTNFVAVNCRHAYSGGGTQYVRLSNVVALGSTSGAVMLAGAFDTHQNTRLFEINGFFIKDYNIAFNQRSEDIYIRNGVVLRSNAFLAIAASAMVREQGKTIAIENVEARETRILIAPNSGTRLSKITLDNVYASTKKEINTNYYNTPLLFVGSSGLDSFYVDSLYVSNSHFHGIPSLVAAGGGKYLMGYVKGGEDSLNYIKYAKFHNNTFDYFRYLFLRGEFGEKKFEFTSNTIDSVLNVFSTTGGSLDDSTEIAMEDWLIQNNTFRNCDNFFSIGLNRVDNLRVIGNTFDNIKYGITLQYGYIGENIIFKDNLFINPDASQELFQWGGAYGNGPVSFVNNVIQPNTGMGKIAYIYAPLGSGYHPYLKFVDNKILDVGLATNALHFMGGIKAEIIKNTFIFNNAAGATHDIFRSDSATVRYIDNYSYMYDTNSHINFIVSEDEGDDLFIIGNTFITEGPPLSSDAVECTVGATILSGINETNFATPVDTTGFGAANGVWTTTTKFGE